MTILRGGCLVDGTGAPAVMRDVVFHAGVIVDIAEPGKADGPGDVIDVNGLVVAPGFIDCHTHYDAQVLWDPDLTPSSWHGVTSVIIGNCGFGIAPTAPAGRKTITRTLENVEGMSFEALTAGIPWTFETFPQYLSAVEAVRPRLNVGAMIGHSPLRLYVMGEEAADRAASTTEIEAMCHLLGEAIDAGAIGFSTSRHPAHAGAWGKPVPSRQATISELAALADILAERGRGVIAITRGPDYDVAEFAELSRRTGRTVTWTALLATHGSPVDVAVTMDQTRNLGGDVWPQIACRPIVFQISLTEPAPFARIKAFAEALAVPAENRRNVYTDAAWRARARKASAEDWPGLWKRVFVAESDASAHLINGPSMADLGTAEARDPLDVLCDIAVADNLRTRFRVVVANDNEEGIAQLLQDDRTVLGLSDAGAHADQLCDAVFATYLLQHWVRESGTLSIEEGVRRLTSQPADLFGLQNRGRLAIGMQADLVAFDASVVGPDLERRVFDLPAGADRLVAKSKGIESVWVNGTPIVLGGQPTEWRSGHVLRGANIAVSDLR